MRFLAGIVIVLPLGAAIGDNAPPIPSTYVTAHPRLPYPDNTFLDAIWNGGSVISRYATDASTYVAKDPSANGGLMAFRRLLLTYLSYKRNNPGHVNTAIYLQKIKDMRLNAGMWAAQQYGVTDLSGSGTGLCTPNCTVTTTAGDFLTGCGGSTCAGKDIGILGRVFAINSVSGDGKSLTLVGVVYEKPNGTNLIGSVINSGASPGNWFPGLAIPLAYDWIYNDLDTASRDEFRAQMIDLLSQYRGSFDNNGPSPFNDNFFLSQSLGNKQIPELMVALAVHDPDNVTWRATTLAALRHATDVWLNILLPAWRVVIGDRGRCGSGTDTSIDCGGAWHEQWSDYTAGTSSRTSMNNWYLTYVLSWASASGRGSTFYTSDEPWLKNIAYWTMYNMRPDFTLERIGAVKYGTMQSEGNGSSTPSMGLLSGLAEMYNDPTLRGWAKTINWRNLAFDEYEPSAWPYYKPLKAVPANSRAALSPVRNFPGVGTIYFRTGWGENDTACYLRYSPFTYWSHPVQDAGSWACFHRGALAIRSGTYFAGEIGYHFWQYAAQAIAHNTILIYDPSDRYTDEGYDLQSNTGATVTRVMPNDGGQRRVGSRMGNGIRPISVELQGKNASPAGWQQLLMSHEYFKGGKLLAYTVGTGNKYTYAAIDITDAYNNIFSRAPHTTAGQPQEANTSNRRYRAKKVVRHLLFLPRGSAAYVVLYDQVISTSTSLAKKNVIHFVNNPAVTAWDGTRASWTVTRSETVSAKPDNSAWQALYYQNIANCPSGCSSGSTQYVYGGKMYGYMTLPAGGTITTIGGGGHEFDITDSSGTVNYKECMLNLCPTGTGLGSVVNEISSDPSSGPNEVGGYRIEQSPGTASLEDWFLNVMLFTGTGDSNVPSTLPSTTQSGSYYVTTWQDALNGCTYTVTLPKYGVGGEVTVAGAGCAATI